MAKPKVAIYIRVDPDLYEKLDELAKKNVENLTVSAFVVKLITAYVASKNE
jgi:predicted transcriptional regulator